MAHVVVVGAGMAGLTAAYTAVQAGHTVTVLEASAVAGGAVQPVTFELPEGVLTVDGGAEAFASRSAPLHQLIDELGLTEQLVTPNPAGSWLYLPDIGAVPAAKLGMWGIPGNPSAPEVVTALGPEGAQRAAQELELPMDTWGARRQSDGPITVGELIADRFGRTVLERLVAPVVAGVHSADPDDIDIDRIAPGLLDTALQLGSVAKAVAQLRSAAPPGAAVKTLTGGMYQLITALVDYLTIHAKLQFNTTVTSLDPEEQSVMTAEGQRIGADHVVLAVDAPTAFDLVSSVAPLADRPRLGAGVALVMLVVDSAALDNAPRGTGMLVSPSVTQVGAKAATHVTAKWAWAQQAGAQLADHRHVLRLSYGRVTDPDDGSALGYDTPDARLLELATADAATLFGLDPQSLDASLVASKIIRWRAEMPLTTPDNAARITALTEAVETTDWLHLTGAWFAGTGLAAIAQQTSDLSFYPLQ